LQKHNAALLIVLFVLIFKNRANIKDFPQIMNQISTGRGKVPGDNCIEAA
jgi:hypothetical protein